MTGDYFPTMQWWGNGYYHQPPCPSCGHCPSCGRGGSGFVPHYVPGWTVTITNGVAESDWQAQLQALLNKAETQTSEQAK